MAMDAAEAGSFELRGLVLLDSSGNHPVVVHALHFGDDGIGLVGREGSPPRVLPWASVSTHAVEPWMGGTIPRWWVKSAGHRGPGGADPRPSDGHPGGGLVSAVEPHREAVATESHSREDRARPGSTTGRAARADDQLPHVEAGALIDIQTPSGTFRFLLPPPIRPRWLNGLRPSPSITAGRPGLHRSPRPSVPGAAADGRVDRRPGGSASGRSSSSSSSWSLPQRSRSSCCRARGPFTSPSLVGQAARRPSTPMPACRRGLGPSRQEPVTARIRWRTSP